MLPLLFPWLIMAIIIVAIVFAFRRKWKIVFLLLLFATLVNSWVECIPYRFCYLHEEENANTIKLLTFNINGNKESIYDKASKISHLIVQESPDIVFLAELSNENKVILDTFLVKHYPYYRLSDWHCFFSKYPLSERIELDNNLNDALGVLKYKVEIADDTIVLYGCHFASNNYSADAEYITPDSINSKNKLLQYISDIELAYSIREKEAKILCDDISKKSEKIVVLGDLNDVGGSISVRLIENQGLKDAWWEGGFGYGATIHKPLPYRIDHILYSGQFKLNRVKVVNSDGLSDHDAVFAEFSY